MIHAAALLLLSVAGSAVMADSMPLANDPVAYHGDWSVFVETSPHECFVSTTPLRSTLTKAGGQTVDSDRRPVLQVTIRPAEQTAGEVSVFVGDETLDIAGDVAMTGKGAPLTLFSRGSWAWPINPLADMQVLAALGTLSEVTLSGTLVDGSSFADVYSTDGVADALLDAARRCAG